MRTKHENQALAILMKIFPPWGVPEESAQEE